MRREGGYGTIIQSGVVVDEHSTYTCGHCNHVKKVKPKERPEDTGGLCKICMSLICSPCVDKGCCDPFEEKLRRMESAYHSRRSLDECL